MTSQGKKKTAELLKKANLRQTHPRLAVLGVLIDADAPITHQQIAENLFISPATVRKHIENIYEKLQVHNKIQAVQKARQQHII